MLNKHLYSLSILCLAGFILPAHASISQPTLFQVSATHSNQFNTLPPLSDEDFRWIGGKIYQNECNSQAKNLTFWGKGEDFPSFGIGHFIWFPKGINPPFNETFPAMFEYVSQTVSPPEWLVKLEPLDAPWQTKAEFEQAWSGLQLSELRDWLERTQAQQAEFIVAQFQIRLDTVLKTLPIEEQRFYKARIAKPMTFKQGQFALIDYVNFKGVGGNTKEQYQGEEWGLLSVLRAMSVPESDGQMNRDRAVLDAFIQAAKARLLLRTQLAPIERNEQRWLKGWNIRLDNYHEVDFKRVN